MRKCARELRKHSEKSGEGLPPFKQRSPRKREKGAGEMLLKRQSPDPSPNWTPGGPANPRQEYEEDVYTGHASVRESTADGRRKILREAGGTERRTKCFSMGAKASGSP